MATSPDKKTPSTKTTLSPKPNEVSPKSSEAKSDPTTNDYFEVKLPKINLHKAMISPLWIILLLILAYLLGMQTAKLTYIEKKMEEDSKTPSQAQAAPQNPQKPALGTKVNVSEGTLPPLGNKNAKITMIEFSDFQCPFCDRFYKDTYAQLKKNYIDTGKVKLVFRNLPLDIHPLAPKAAEAAECANDQDKFWEFHDEVFNNYDSWSQGTQDALAQYMETYAGNIGLDVNEFSSCLTSGKFADKVAKDKSDASTAGATGTPSFFINGKILVGALPYDTFKTLLDEELKK